LPEHFYGPLAQSAVAADQAAGTATGDPVATRSAASIPTASPIKHVIVVVSENRSFDHLFATYVPKPGNRVNNLLSEGIIRADGSPGANYSQAVQHQGTTSVVPTHHSISYVILSGALAREIPIRFLADRASAQSKDLRFRGTLRKGHRGGRRIQGTQSAQDLSSLVRRGERGICFLASSHRPLAADV
jgi:hypothetical protein